MARKGPTRTGKAPRDRDILLDSLRRHGRVIEAENEDVALPAGVTHVLVKEPGNAEPRLVEKRKSFF